MSFVVRGEGVVDGSTVRIATCGDALEQLATRLGIHEFKAPIVLFSPRPCENQHHGTRFVLYVNTSA